MLPGPRTSLYRPAWGTVISGGRQAPNPRLGPILRAPPAQGGIPARPHGPRPSRVQLAPHSFRGAAVIGAVTSESGRGVRSPASPARGRRRQWQRRRRRQPAAHTVPRGRRSWARGSAPPASKSSRAATATATSTRPWSESESRGRGGGSASGPAAPPPGTRSRKSGTGRAWRRTPRLFSLLMEDLLAGELEGRPQRLLCDGWTLRTSAGRWAGRSQRDLPPGKRPLPIQLVPPAVTATIYPWRKPAVTWKCYGAPDEQSLTFLLRF